MSAFFNGRLLNLAHRGVSREAPENTLAAFRLAEARGADGIELDVRLCRSGEPVVMHDARLNRTTDGRGYVRRKTLEQLQRLDAGSHFHERFAQERVPSLDEVLRWSRGRMLVNIEIKSFASRRLAGIEAAVIDLLHRHRMAHQCLISSFNPLALRRLTRLDSRVATALLMDRRLYLYRSELPLSRLSGVRGLNIHARLATARFVHQCKRAGLRVMVWGASRREELEQLTELGIDGIISDEPLLLKKLLERNG
jgi:glycerophosphoryl diester phosphodiesterase